MAFSHQLSWRGAAPPDASRLLDAADIAPAVARARQAQPAWAAQPLTSRLQVVRRVRHALATQAAHFVATVPQGPRRSQAETLVAEVLPLADACRFLEREAGRLLAPQRRRTPYRPLWLTGVDLEVRREPYGVVGIIAPSNYPLLLPGVQALQALTAGNAVLLKPGAGGLAAAQALQKCVVQAGLEPALIQVLPETPEAARAACAAGLDKVVLTGSATTGAAVLAALAPQLTPATLELSGCDAAFVQTDADVDLAVAALTFGLRFNGGATCIAPRRVFVHHTLTDALAARLVQAAQSLPAYPVASTVVARLSTLLNEACSMGARVLAGGCLSDTSVAPLIVGQALPGMRLLQADLFAPLLALVSVRSDDEALAAAAACPYALGATIFGSERGARALATRVSAGVVVVNDMIVPTADPRLPFGGRGRSGFGSTRGAEGLLELTVCKAIVVQRRRWHPHLVPPTAQDEALFQAYLALIHGASLGRRLRAGWELIRALSARVRAR